MKRVVLIICFLITTIVLYGCGRDVGKVDKPPTAPIRHSDSIEVDIYLDGTYSMAGYVDFSNTTIYCESLKNIERTENNINIYSIDF